MVLSKQGWRTGIGYIGLFVILIIAYMIIPSSYIKLRSTRLRNVQYADNLRWCIDKVESKDKQVEITGWLINPGNSTGSQKTEVIIRNNTNGKCYKANTDMVKRSDLNYAFRSEKCDYSFAGYSTIFNPKRLKGNLSDYTIILKYKNGNEEYCIDTGRNLEG